MFKEIPWFEWRYSISKDWVVVSISDYRMFICEWKILKWHLIRAPYFDKNWYKRVSLTLKNWSRKWYWVHQLVMLTYVWPYPSSNHQINHKNWDKSDASLENLEYVTPLENSNKKNPSNIYPKWKNHWWYWRKWKLSKLSKPVWQFKDWELVATYEWLADCARKTWFNPSNIWCVIHWTRQNQCHWFTFKYI